MNMPSALYRPSLALLSDLYQLTMVYGYWKGGRCDDEAVFHLHFRKHPFGGGYTVAAGLASAVDWLMHLRLDSEDRSYLASLKAADGSALFEPAFVEWLSSQPLTIDVDAVPEGELVFPHEPLVRITGPLWQGQLVETALLTLVNFQTLIATKAARICHAAQGDPVVDFGLRRAQGIDGSISACRAAFIGGVSATSNVLAGRLLGVPVRGTHAHSWVMSFGGEQEAFDAYSSAMPANTLLLVDTYDTIEGVRRAIKVGLRLKAQGRKFLGVRLDSGDLAYLSIQARAMLDEAGLHDASVVASNDLDEQTIQSLKQQGAKVNVWGVGTRLITAYDQPALGGVYKLGAVRAKGGAWRPVIKASEQLAKASVPGILGVRRYFGAEGMVADMIYDQMHAPGGDVIVDPSDPIRRRRLQGSHREVLIPVLRKGVPVAASETIAQASDRRKASLGLLHESSKRLLNPHAYPAGLELGLHERRTEMVLQARAAHAMSATTEVNS